MVFQTVGGTVDVAARVVASTIVVLAGLGAAVLSREMVQEAGSNRSRGRAIAVGVVAIIVLLLRPRWPATRTELAHVIAAGLLMHAVQLGGSHYAQYLGMSAGIAALVLSTLLGHSASSP